jgi:DNA-binding Xre family transcriptional regulator
MDWDKYPTDLHCRLGEILKEKEMSALQLSMEVKHRRATINDLINNREMNKKRIPAQLIARICTVLDITPDQLFRVKKQEPL